MGISGGSSFIMTWEFYQSLGPGCGDKKILFAACNCRIEKQKV